MVAMVVEVVVKTCGNDGESNDDIDSGEGSKITR